ncbi:hypothetical protein Lal_00017603 [Lupinus albus]|nr:hypothetical protein Lal_00017603 [Lupinus albus]
MMIGSKPPDCINKCMNCSPCMATLVIPNYPKWKGFKALTPEEEEEEENEIYYHLSWKCKCGDKLFPPRQT